MFRYPPFAFVHSWLPEPYSVGVLLFGVALVRARVFPRSASVLFTIGVLLSEGVLFPPFVIRTIGGVLGAPAIRWVARLLWSRARPERATTQNACLAEVLRIPVRLGPRLSGLAPTPRAMRPATLLIAAPLSALVAPLLGNLHVRGFLLPRMRHLGIVAPSSAS